MTDSHKAGRHPQQMPGVYGLTPRTTERVDQHAKTKESFPAIDDETVPRDFQGFVALYMRDRRKTIAREVEVDGRFATLDQRMAAYDATVEATRELADGASGHSLEAQAKVGALVVEMRTLAKRLEDYPAESKKVGEDVATSIATAGRDAGAEFAGLVADVRKTVKRWAWLVALVAGVVAGAGTWLGGRVSAVGVADEAAAKTLENAPKPPPTAERERIIFIDRAPALPGAAATPGDY